MQAPPAPDGAGGDLQAALLAEQQLTNQLMAATVAELRALRTELAPQLQRLATLKIPRMLGG